MELSTALAPQCVSVGVHVEDKGSLLREIAAVAMKNPACSRLSEREISHVLEGREQLGSTGFGDGIAIPHCRLKNVSEFVVGLLTIPSGVDFDAMDGKAVKLVVFIVGPARDTNEHVRVLAEISHALRSPGAKEEILAATTPEAARESFLRYARDRIDANQHENKRLMHIFVQDEDVFHPILNVVVELGADSAIVVDTLNTSEYLAKMPLFSGLFTDTDGGSSRLIMTVVDTSLTNEMIRQIEQIAGRLDERRGVLITVQNLHYTSGSLNP